MPELRHDGRKVLEERRLRPVRHGTEIRYGPDVGHGADVRYGADVGHGTDVRQGRLNGDDDPGRCPGGAEECSRSRFRFGAGRCR